MSLLTEDEKWAIVAEKMRDTTNDLLDLADQFRKIRAGLQAIDMRTYSAVTRDGGPLPSKIEVNGKMCPDDVPEKYRDLAFFDDIMNLPTQYLDRWLAFHGENLDVLKDQDHLDKAKLLYVLRYGTMNDAVPRYEEARDQAREQSQIKKKKSIKDTQSVHILKDKRSRRTVK
ncbi:uncharacterized protein I303_108545 [Kwoniella dejecticola CBS 10117]|uniref:Uncharacterized protein n=1 Tax=Kwoniella dejecticola CBS 10117 TaxID=1296121 RepID=A0A1A5ZX44_9TREE|nr:uncharacterized protein I303_07131 [Kwoniella dejecticola CBS 10117]OBR82372.1 hypothetical protein I303_07131 [Kwoniella dejecticola CBS 10117]